MHTEPMALVTGASGFLGRHLVQYLKSQGIAVASMGVHTSSTCQWHIHLQSITNTTSIKKAITDLPSTPRWIFHLAGTISKDIFSVNTAWAIALLDAVVNIVPCPIIILIGSAAEYGPQQTNLESQFGYSITEKTICIPESLYGKSKLAQTWAGLYASLRQPVIIVRPFNILGPGMPLHLALAHFIQQAKSLPPKGSNLERCIHTGPLHAVRDFIDVQTCVRALWHIANKQEALGQIINLCTGQGISMSYVVNTLLTHLSPPICLKTDLAATVLPDVIVGNPDKLRLLDFEPGICDISNMIGVMLHCN